MDKTNKYEMITILDPNLSSDDTDTLVETIENNITKNKGSIKKTSKWGRKKLAYEINKFNDGFFVLINFTANPMVIAEIDRVLKINDKIIRHIVVKERESKNG